MIKTELLKEVKAEVLSAGWTDSVNFETYREVGFKKIIGEVKTATLFILSKKVD